MEMAAVQYIVHVRHVMVEAGTGASSDKWVSFSMLINNLSGGQA